jgi:ATP-binding cassette, subfamily B, bacterial
VAAVDALADVATVQSAPRSHRPNCAPAPESDGPAADREDAALLQRLMLRRGLRIAAPVVDRPRCDLTTDSGSSLRAAALALNGLGVRCRPVRVEVAALRTLPLPTLVALPDGRRAIAEVHGRQMTCEFFEGECVPLTLALPPPRAQITALDFGVALPPGTTWMRRLCSALVADRMRLVALMLAAAFGQGLGLVGPAMTWLIVDTALPGGATNLLMVVALGLALVSLHATLVAWWRDRLVRSLDARLQLGAQEVMLSHLLRLKYAVVAQREVGSSLQVLASAERTAIGLLATGFWPLVDAAMMVGAWAMIASILPGAALALGMGAVAVIVLSVPLARANAAWQARQFDARAAEQTCLHDLIAGASTLRVAGAEHAGTRRWLRRMIDEQAATLGQVRAGLWLDVLFEGTYHCTSAALLIWGAYACLAGWIELGAFLAAAMLADTFVRSAIRLGHCSVALYGLQPHLERVNRALAEAVEATSPSSADDLSSATEPAARVNDASAGALSVDHVWFRYSQDAPWVISDYSLRIPVGALVIMRGESGSGKTTLLRLIAGLFDPARGDIAVFGRAPSNASDLIAYLPQDARLFEGSIESNLRWLSQAREERIREAACATGLDVWIAALPLGYATPVPPGATNLSGGERQWIALTGALASGRPLLLLDEAMSQMDRLTRLRLLERGVFAGKTVLMVTHDQD